MKLRLLVKALIVGAVLTAVPQLARLIESETGILGFLKFGLSFLSLPGTVVALIVSGNVHEVNELVIACGSFICYVVVAYFALLMINKHAVGAERLNVHLR